ncbi:unnamed protein product [Psylliodes chrysocephalus]|uniref:CRAL-TRIO domain-containing protein n=1 Tax=Psylliodes chrysocephalus TaxID=3402493 RepID=A0A9P0GCG0_9CUCU|nr:unnamed protein product [Psylliodes chrysocephala]
MASPFALDYSPPSAETLALAEKELRETPENIKTALAELKELLKNDDEIYFKDDDEVLTIFLRPCKWYAKSAYELMKRIADFKVKHASLVGNLVPDSERIAFTEHDVVNVMTNLDHKGRRVLIVNSGETWDPSKVTSDQMFRLFYIIHMLAVLEPSTQINGVVVIMDYNNMGLKQVRGLGPSFAMLLLSFIQEAMPLRLKEVHMVKEPFIFNMVWSLFKPLLKPKLKARIFFHGKKMASLHKHIPPTHLPKNYGGELPEIDYSGKEWYPVVLDPKVSAHINMMNTFGKKKKDK